VAVAWSARNSHHARLAAAARLAERIKKETSGASGEAVVIAHSHGGNVALYAMRDPEVEARVVGVVCLATPFLVVTPRSIRDLSRRLSRAVAICVVATAAFFAYASAIARGPSASNKISLVGVLVLAAGTLLALWRYIGRWALRSIEAAQTRYVADLHLPEVRRTPMLVLRAAGDEARAWLSGLSAVADAPSVLLARVITSSAFFGGTVVSMMHPVPGVPANWIARLALGLSSGAACAIAAMLVLCIVVPLWSMIWIGHPAGYGWPRFVLDGLVKTAVQRQPPESARMDVRVFRGEARGLRHSEVYRDVECIDLVASWVGQVAGRVVEPASGQAHVAPEPRPQVVGFLESTWAGWRCQSSRSCGPLGTPLRSGSLWRWRYGSGGVRPDASGKEATARSHGASLP
jgi:hypothetical protein